MSTAKNSRARRTRVQGIASTGERGGFLRLSRLRQLRECEQVAAVCYRIRGISIEFLLVQTRGSGRWTFPKGNAEPGMTHAQAAALEAFEEAGVHGRIQEASFAQYVARKRILNSSARSAEMLMVNAHLCEVLRLGKPKEDKRNRTWFSVEDAREQLQEGRKRDEAAAYARVVDRAVQISGSLGVSGDLPPARILAEVRPFRIYDGPTETHKWAIARRALRQRAAI